MPILPFYHLQVSDLAEDSNADSLGFTVTTQIQLPFREPQTLPANRV